jgi:hypothetical protein
VRPVRGTHLRRHETLTEVAPDERRQARRWKANDDPIIDSAQRYLHAGRERRED